MDDALYGPVEPHELFPDWNAILGFERPMHVEIGSGRGHFALDYAAREPVNLVAIEQRRSDCDTIRERRAKRGIRNLEVIQGDAVMLLPRYFRPESVAGFHVHCPDPWWKNRHHRRRLIADDFVLLLWKLLVPGGELDLRTDVPAYAKVMVETCEDILGFENVHGPGVERPVEGLVLSTRERRYRETGQPVFRYAYRRPAGPPKTEAVDEAVLRRAWRDVRRK
jgi:tRNA (guanine-N7-)-methyltransferase